MESKQNKFLEIITSFFLDTSGVINPKRKYWNQTTHRALNQNYLKKLDISKVMNHGSLHAISKIPLALYECIKADHCQNLDLTT